jgi:uncharacterized membrane protein
MLMKIHVKNETHDFGFWLPIFLVLPVALVVLIILLPLIIVGMIIFWDSWGVWALKVLWAAIVSYWSLHGLEVDVQNGNKYVYVSVV